MDISRVKMQLKTKIQKFNFGFEIKHCSTCRKSKDMAYERLFVALLLVTFAWPKIDASINNGSPNCQKVCKGLPRKARFNAAVCGSDWKTYANECELRIEACKTRQAIIPVYKGKCIKKGKQGPFGDEASCATQINCDGLPVKPVCGSDGDRYSNECNLIKRACFSKMAIVKVSTIGKQDETERERKFVFSFFSAIFFCSVPKCCRFQNLPCVPRIFFAQGFTWHYASPKIPKTKATFQKTSSS
eukprot:gene15040-16593_t